VKQRGPNTLEGEGKGVVKSRQKGPANFRQHFPEPRSEQSYMVRDGPNGGKRSERNNGGRQDLEALPSQGKTRSRSRGQLILRKKGT